MNLILYVNVSHNADLRNVLYSQHDFALDHDVEI